MKEREVGGLRFRYGLNVHAHNITLQVSITTYSFTVRELNIIQSVHLIITFLQWSILSVVRVGVLIVPNKEMAIAESIGFLQLN